MKFFNFALLATSAVNAAVDMAYLTQVLDHFNSRYSDATYSLDLAFINKAIDEASKGNVNNAIFQNILSTYEQDLMEQDGRAVGASPIHKLMPYWGYGCYCNFDNTYFKGRGAPVDEMDELCKAASQCYACVVMDGDDENQTCDPHVTGYTAITLPSGQPGEPKQTIQQSCSHSDNNNCSKRTCNCQLDFVSKAWNLMMSGKFNLNLPAYKHSEGNFDDAVCDSSSAGSGGPPKEPECCGQYPSRKPYYSNKMACCKDTNVFNMHFKKCCEDGSTVMIGNDCK